MNKEKLELIERIISINDLDIINTLYEIIVNNDYDYIENLFTNDDEFKEFIEKYKGDQ